MSRSAMYCEHANEAPRACRCDGDCYCKEHSCRGRLVRNMDTPESRKFWEDVERTAAEVRTWPDWKRAGINESSTRETPRRTPRKRTTDAAKSNSAALHGFFVALACIGYAAAMRPVTRFQLLEVD